MSQRVSVEGSLHWADDYQPIGDVTVQLCTADGAAVATVKSDKGGRYEAAIPSGPAIHLVLLDEHGRIFHSTRDAAVLLQGTSCRLDTAVPAEARAPGAEGFRAEVSDLVATVRDAADPETLLDVARALVSPSRASGAAASLAATVEQSLCGTPVLEAMEEAIRANAWPRETAHQIDDILALRDSGFASATYQSANFSVTYQTSGPAAVPATTATETILDPGTTTDLATVGDGVTPTYVLRICYWLERALASYTAPPFSMKNPAAAGRIPVVINTAPYGLASSSGTFYLNNNLPAELICAVGVHELFHMVQYQYGTTLGPWRYSVMEGGAVFAEDSAADKLNRYLDEAGSNFNGIGTQANPNLSLMSAGYKCCLFWRYVAEQQSADITEPFVGVETYRSVMERCAAGSYSTADVRAALRELPWYQDFYEFSYLDPQRLDLTNAETALGNYALACYLKDLGVNVPDRRFDFIEDEENIYIDEVVGGPSSTTLISPTLAGSGTVSPASSAAFTGAVNSFAHRHYEIAVDPSVQSVEVVFNAGSGLTSCLFQIALIDQNGNVRDIHRTDRTSYTKRVANAVGGKKLAKILAVVTGATTSGPFSLSVGPAAPAPDIMITRWNSVIGTEYEIDSRNWAWTWVSPDVWVDNNNDGAADGIVYFNTDNKLHIRLHNKGNADAQNIQIEAFYQDASLGLSPTAWQPVKNVAGVAQVLSGLSLAAGATQDWVMDWSPNLSRVSEHFCVRVVVSAAGDPNTDNKRALSNFGCVRIKLRLPKNITDLLERLRKMKLHRLSVQVIPRLAARQDIAISSRDIRDLQLGRLDTQAGLRISHVSAVRPDAGSPDRPGSGRITPFPDAVRSYPTNPKALPPGVAGKPMVTIAATEGGVVLGGVTLLIEVEE